MQKVDGYKLARKLFNINQIMKKRGVYYYNGNDQNFYGIDDKLYVNTRLKSQEFKDLLEGEERLPSLQIDGQELFNADKELKEFNKNSRKEDPKKFESQGLKKELFFDIKNLTLLDKEGGDVVYKLTRVRHRDIERLNFAWDHKPRKTEIHYINGVEIKDNDQFITDIIGSVIVEEDLYSWSFAIFEEDNEIVFADNHEIIVLDNAPYVQTNKHFFIKLDATKKKIQTQFLNTYICDKSDELQQIGIEYGTDDYCITHCANIVLKFNS